MKILVTGANGLLGQHLVKLLIEHNYLVAATGKGPSRLPFAPSAGYKYFDTDIRSDVEWIDILSLEQPQVIVHAASATRVDDCEQNKDACFDTNVKGTYNVLSSAASHGTHFIYISTDFVFNGRKGNYSEDDQPDPISWYGYTKMTAENLVRESALPWTIVRTCLVYGNVLRGTRTNIVNWVRENLEKEKTIKVVDDQWRTPTYVQDLAKGILLTIGTSATGIYHISGKEVLTPYEMATRTADFFQLDKRFIERADASTFSQPAKRPAKTGFDISKATFNLGYQPVTFEEGLRSMFNDA